LRYLHRFSPEQIAKAKVQAVLNPCDPDPPSRQAPPLALPCDGKPAHFFDKFIRERCDVPGDRVLFKDFRVAFGNWLPSTEAWRAMSLYIRKELLARGFDIKPGPHNKRYVHGLALRPLQEKAQ
jgi:hypothetical protein